MHLFLSLGQSVPKVPNEQPQVAQLNSTDSSATSSVADATEKKKKRRKKVYNSHRMLINIT